MGRPGETEGMGTRTGTPTLPCWRCWRNTKPRRAMAGRSEPDHSCWPCWGSRGRPRLLVQRAELPQQEHPGGRTGRTRLRRGPIHSRYTLQLIHSQTGSDSRIHWHALRQEAGTSAASQPPTPTCPLDLLSRLGRDRAISVRAAAAANPTCPLDLLSRLGRDRAVSRPRRSRLQPRLSH